MPGPENRAELLAALDETFGKLRVTLDGAGPRAGSLPCVDGWSVKDLLAVRAWWTEAVVGWVEAGSRGEAPPLPAEGYGWNETPRLNADVVRRERRTSYRATRERLERGYAAVLATIDALDDDELEQVGAHAWAGRHPLVRWIAINTSRQYATARTHVRRALRARGAGSEARRGDGC